MPSIPRRPVSPAAASVTTAMICSGAVMAQFIGGKAARDALYLAHMDAVTTLPTMVITTSIVSLILVAASAKVIARVSPSYLVPAMFAVSAGLLLLEWVLLFNAPKVAVVLVYLHISGLGPMLGSGFWLISSERFDPRTARRRFGQIQGAGTLGGIIGGLLAERVGAVLGIGAMLPVLATLNILCALAISELAGDAHPRLWPVEVAAELAPAAPRSSIRVLSQAPYLRNLAASVLLGTAAVALIDYLFKVEAVKAFGNGDDLLRFFAIYYAATSLVTFVVQISSSRFALDRFGLALPAAMPSVALIAGGVGALVWPGIGPMMAARGGEAVLRGSFFRSAYELFFTPLPSAEKRAAKSIIDVGADRVGDAVGGGAVLLIRTVIPAAQSAMILMLAIVSSTAALLVATRLRRGYIDSLERSLVRQAVELDLSDVYDRTTRDTVTRFLPARRNEVTSRQANAEARTLPRGTMPGAEVDPQIERIKRLRFRDREQVRKVLQDPSGLTSELIPHVIPLLAWDAVSTDAIAALRKSAEAHVGALIDALVDPNEDFATRRRLARVFSACTSQRAADGLMLGLDDLRFEVRFQCARSLAAILEKNSLIRIDKERVFEVVLREVAVGQKVWESHRLLDASEARESASYVDEFVRARAGQSLAHVFTLLSLVLPREPVQVAFRGLHTEDRNLQGTALEYLEGVLPRAIRERLWPFLEDNRAPDRTRRSADEVRADLMEANHSIVLNLEQLKRAKKAPSS